MIFVTVGSMLPFDRLVRAVDAWASTHPEEEVVSQIGHGSYTPRHGKWYRTLTPNEYGEMISRSSLVVAHAGMGTLLKCLEVGRPLVVLPRRATEREVTTDHQLHAAQWLSGQVGVRVALTETELGHLIDDALLDGGRRDEGVLNAKVGTFVERLRAEILKI